MATTLQIGSMHQTEVRAASGTDVLAGLWLIAAPFVFNYSANGGSVWNDVTVGIVIALLAAVQVSEGRSSSWASWLNVGLGAWLIVAPFALGFPTGSAAMWNDIILGGVVGILALFSALTVSGDSDTESYE